MSGRSGSTSSKSSEEERPRPDDNARQGAGQAQTPGESHTDEPDLHVEENHDAGQQEEQVQDEIEADEENHTVQDRQEAHPLLRKQRTVTKLHLEPPERLLVRNQTRYHIRLLGLSWSGRVREPLCARAHFEPHPKRGLYTEIKDWTTNRARTSGQHWVLSFNSLFNVEGELQCFMETQRRYTHNHIVVGIMNKWTGIPRERVMQDIPPQHLFLSIRRAARQLRPWWKRVLSLKSIQGFSMYQCLPDNEYHQAVEPDHQTEILLTELFHDYTRRNVLSELRWLPWIQQNFNHGDSEPGKPCYALQLVLRWSITKIIVYGLTPVLLSLAIGFWFQYTQDGDRIAVVQTAWTISAFIIGGASLLIAVTAAITQIGGV